MAKGMKIITYRKTTPERLVELLERIDWSTRLHSSDGTYKGIYDKDKKYTGYMIIGDKVVHELTAFRGGTTFYFKDCIFKMIDKDTVCISQKNSTSVFILFHNFRSNK